MYKLFDPEAADYYDSGPRVVRFIVHFILCPVRKEEGTREFLKHHKEMEYLGSVSSLQRKLNKLYHMGVLNGEGNE